MAGRITKALTIADLERQTGGKIRSLRLWADAGAIRPLPGTAHAGRGVHREFPESEIPVARALVALAWLGLPIGVMLDVAGVVRRRGDARGLLPIVECGGKIVPADECGRCAGKHGVVIVIDLDAIASCGDAGAE